MYRKIEIIDDEETCKLNLPIVNRSYLNRIGWWLVKRTCKHESKTLISYDHTEQIGRYKCKICSEEIYE